MKTNSMNTNYYLIKPSSEGCYPQVDCEDIPTIQLIKAWNMYPDGLFTLDFTLKKRAIITDVLSKIGGPVTDFLINEKFKSIISNCKIMKHQFFDASIKTKKGVLSYSLLHLSQTDLVNYIDYGNSLFSETEWTFEKCPLKLSSYEDFTLLQSKDKEGKFGVSIKKLVMNEHFDRSIDMFFLYPFEVKVYVSERMKALIENNNITGLNFVEKISI